MKAVQVGYLGKPKWWWKEKHRLQGELRDLSLYIARLAVGAVRAEEGRALYVEKSLRKWEGERLIHPKVLEIVKHREDQILSALIGLNMMTEGDFTE